MRNGILWAGYKFGTYFTEYLQREAHIGQKRVAITTLQTRRLCKFLFVAVELGICAILEVTNESGYQ